MTEYLPEGYDVWMLTVSKKDGNLVFTIQPAESRQRTRITTACLDISALFFITEINASMQLDKIILAGSPEFTPGITVDGIERLAGVNRLVKNCFEILSCPGR